MSVITFRCKEHEKEKVKSVVWEIIKDHYYHTVFPNSHVEYDKNAAETYLSGLDELMHAQLCSMEDTADGIAVTFDSTEDAGYAIAENVYHTLMGYNDQGLTYLYPIFEKIVAALPGIPFEADVEIEDEQIGYEEHHYSFDGKSLRADEDNEEPETPVGEVEHSEVDMPVMKGSNPDDVEAVLKANGFNLELTEDNEDGTDSSIYVNSEDVSFSITFSKDTNELLEGGFEEFFSSGSIDLNGKKQFLKAVAKVLCPKASSERVIAWVESIIDQSDNNKEINFDITIDGFVYELGYDPSSFIIYKAGRRNWSDWVDSLY